MPAMLPLHVSRPTSSFFTIPATYPPTALCFRRPIQSGLLWRDGGILHVAYYDGFIRVGIIVEEYDDMLLVQVCRSVAVRLAELRRSFCAFQRLSVSKNNVSTLLDVIFAELKRLSDYEDAEREKRHSMLEKMKNLKAKVGALLSHLLLLHSSQLTLHPFCFYGMAVESF